MSFDRFSEERRKSWQNPEAILGRVGLKLDSIFVDVGCGDGFFAIPASRLVGEGGRVYGLDIDRRAISELRNKARREGLDNLILRIERAEEAVLCNGCADIVFFANDLHDFEGPTKVLANARKMIKPSGRLVDLDWKKKSAVVIGPPMRIRFSETEAAHLIEEAGFVVESVEDSGPYHYLIMAKPVSQSKEN